MTSVARAVSISVATEDDTVSVCSWRITQPEADELYLALLDRFGDPVMTLAPAEMLTEFDNDPRVVSTE